MAGEQHRRERMSPKRRLMTSTLPFKSLCLHSGPLWCVCEKLVFFPSLVSHQWLLGLWSKSKKLKRAVYFIFHHIKQNCHSSSLVFLPFVFYLISRPALWTFLNRITLTNVKSRLVVLFLATLAARWRNTGQIVVSAFSCGTTTWLSLSCLANRANHRGPRHYHDNDGPPQQRHGFLWKSLIIEIY